MNCKNCGAPIGESQSFCSSCGTNAVPDNQAFPPQGNGAYVPPEWQTPSQPFGQQPYGQQPYQGPQPGYPHPPEVSATAQKRVNGALIGAIVGLVFGIIAFFWDYVLFITLFAGIGAIATAAREKKNGANTTVCLVFGVLSTVFGAILLILFIIGIAAIASGAI